MTAWSANNGPVFGFEVAIEHFDLQSMEFVHIPVL